MKNLSKAICYMLEMGFHSLLVIIIYPLPRVLFNNVILWQLGRIKYLSGEFERIQNELKK